MFPRNYKHVQYEVQPQDWHTPSTYDVSSFHVNPTGHPPSNPLSNPPSYTVNEEERILLIDEQLKILETTRTEYLRELLNDPLKEFSIPAPGDKHELFVSFRCFKPKLFMHELVGKRGGTNDLNLLQEIEEFISLRIRVDHGDSHPFDTGLRFNDLKFNFDSLCENVLPLREKKVDSFFLLRAMFPHFSIRQELECLQAQKPNKNKSCSCKDHDNDEIDNSLLHFHLIAFGGLIPSKKVLKEGVREALIICHLYCLFALPRIPIIKYSNQFSEIPILTCHFLIKKHIDISQLSDERRLNELVSLEVVTSGGGMTRKTEEFFKSISKQFREEVNFGLID